MSDAADVKAEAEPGRKRGWLKIALLLVAVLLLSGGGLAGYFYWKSTQAGATGGQSEKGAAKEAAQVKAEEGESGLLSFEPFVVNLADAEASRFLRVNLRLVIDKDEEDVKKLEEDKVVMTRLRSSILELLATKTSGELGSADGKDALKEQIEALAGRLLTEAKVRDVLFVEFVVQF